MQKKIATKIGIGAVSCLIALSGILSGNTKIHAEEDISVTGTPLERSSILGFSAVAGNVYMNLNRDNIEKQITKGDTNIVLAQFTISNSSNTNIEVNSPRFYALADTFFVLKDNIRNVVLFNKNNHTSLEGFFVGNGIDFKGIIIVPAYGTVTISLTGDVTNSAQIAALDLEPDFTSPEFVINYADEMGNDIELAPFNLTGETQSLEFSSNAGGVNIETADNSAYAKYYWTVTGTLSSPYVPEGTVVRNEAGIDVYIVKYNNSKRFMRLILNPSVFNGYQHLKWSNILTVNDVVMKSYAISSYVKVAGEDKIWRLEPDEDTGVKREFEGYGNPEWAFDSDGIYEINMMENNIYSMGEKIK